MKLRRILAEHASLIAVVCVLMILVCSKGIYPVYTWDVFGYYIYLPLVFDGHDVMLRDLSYMQQLTDTYGLQHNSLYQFGQSDIGIYYTRYTAGWAILHLPFYLVAEAWAALGGYERNGFSYPYMFMMLLGCYFYVILGLYVAQRVFRIFFGKGLAGLLLLILVFGTNYLFFARNQLGVSHLYEFMLIGVFICLLHSYFKKNTHIKALALGLCFGLMVLIRPPDAVFGLMFLLWEAATLREFMARLRFWLSEKWLHTLLIGLSAFFVLSIQLVYWHKVSGEWFINSYKNNPGEGLDLLTPYIVPFLFSFKKGWFLYTPMSALAFAGLFISLRRERNAPAIFFSCLLFLYVISCWTTWWYAGSFSSRAAIDMYIPLFTGLGFLILRVGKSLVRFVVYPLIAVFFVLNLFQTLQAERRIIHMYRMTRPYYLSVFAQLEKPSEEQLSLLSFDADAFWEKGQADLSQYSCVDSLREILPLRSITPEKEFDHFIRYAQTSYTRQSSHYLLQVSYTYEGDTSGLAGTIFVTTVKHKDAAYNWKAFALEQGNIEIDTLHKNIRYLYCTPNFRSAQDLVELGVWKRSGAPLRLKTRQLRVYKPLFDPK